MQDIIIRDACLEDAAGILEIYAYYVENTAITFEYEVPSLEEFTERMKVIMEKYPYIVMEKDGRIKGYAYASAFRTRPAYGWACDMTIYLDRGIQKCGMGRKLYGVLEEKLKAMGVLNCYACIGYPKEEDAYLTSNSADFHAHVGYREVGRFHDCGYKFGKWYDMLYMEKMIGEHTRMQPGVKAYRDINLIENELFEKYHIIKRIVSERDVYIIPSENLDCEWQTIVGALGWNEDLIRSSYIDIIRRFENIPLFLGIVHIEEYKKPCDFMPSLCLYQDGEYHLVWYNEQWFCQNCMYQTPRQFAGFTNVLMPLFEHDGLYYPDRNYPPIPPFFQKRKCPKCGYTIHQHIFCLEDEFQIEK